MSKKDKKNAREARIGDSKYVSRASMHASPHASGSNRSPQPTEIVVFFLITNHFTEHDSVSYSQALPFDCIGIELKVVVG